VAITGQHAFDYLDSSKVCSEGHPFYALIMAAMRQADTFNLERLKSAWPDVYDELWARYNAPGGLLPGEEQKSG